MTEEKSTRTSAKPVTEEQKAQLAAKTVPATTPGKQPSSLDDLLMGFIMFRRSQVYVPRLGGNIGGAAAIEAAKSEAVLGELEKLVMWLRDGAPNPQQRLSEAEKEKYRWALQQGLEVPEEIRVQL
jgi:hypothetical protein